MSTQAQPDIDSPRASSGVLDSPDVISRVQDRDSPARSTCLLVVAALWLAIFFTSLFAPPLFDDADATHANAARHILSSGDWVTLRVNGIRYLEKAPLPYWLDAISFRMFGFNAFAAHLPQAIAVLFLALLGFVWAERAFSRRAALYTGVFVLTSAGVFLFTRIFIPEVWLSLFLCGALYAFLRSMEIPSTGSPSLVSDSWKGVRRTPLNPSKTAWLSAADKASHTSRQHAVYPYLMWLSLALAVLTKGLVALVFFLGTALVYLALVREYRHWRRLKPFSGILLFVAVAAPWHVLAGLRNTGGMNGHGFFWFYFINEHILRFLGRRYPRDYNKLPGYLFWSLHLVWLFPWALFVPTTVLAGWRRVKSAGATISSGFAGRTILILGLFSALVLLFFSFSTNQEYYTFPAYLPLLMLIAFALTRAELLYKHDASARRWMIFGHAVFAVTGAGIAIALFAGLWSSRHLAFVPDIGSLLAHRGVGDYTLSMSHMFDLTGSSFAALRLPAVLAAVAFAFGPSIAWFLRTERRHLAATSAIALTSAAFLVAAHIALVRFGPMMSSQNIAAKIEQLRSDRLIAPDTQLMMYGDQSYGSSIPFYLGEHVSLVEGRSSSMLFGSTFPDAPPIFLTDAELLRGWGAGPRKLLFVPLEKRDAVDRVLGEHQIVLAETSGKALITDRPLDRAEGPSIY